MSMPVPRTLRGAMHDSLSVGPRTPHGEICFIPLSLCGAVISRVRVGTSTLSNGVSPLPLVRRQLMSMSFVP
jgi:hypothetical protein